MNHILLPELLPKQCPHLLKESLFTTSCLYSPVASRVDCKPLHFLYDVSNNYWQGLLFHRYADIYTSRVSNFLRYSPFMYFRSQSQVWMTSSTIIKPLGFLLYGLTPYSLNMSAKLLSYDIMYRYFWKREPKSVAVLKHIGWSTSTGFGVQDVMSDMYI